MLTIQAIPAFKDNYIWFIQVKGSQKVIIVDPGDAEPVIKAIERQKLTPVAVLITHGHHDHVGGVDELLKRYDVPVYGSKNELVPCLTHPLSACENLVIDPLFPMTKVLDIPGHTQGHIAFLMDGNLFCGDTLFGAGCGRIFSGTATLLFKALQTIAQLPKETLIYCAHEYTENNLRFAAMIEPDNAEIQQRIKDTAVLRQQAKPSIPFTLGLELATNPFMRCEQRSVISSTEKHTGQVLATPNDIFRALRIWKDRF
ncbi:MAG: hydroxyacylglutathione hydrolase [Methylophaga sp.]|nr:MAG: hydroxyacylglutathione hydrolase [Methylophaga sp.]